jgi:NADP-dependent 3-hydroxy acid dehydrogenase YdfG
MRLKDKIAIVVGAGQSPGEGMGNGRATVLRFVQEGAKVLAVDNNAASAEETAAMARQSGGECLAFEADVAKERTLAAMVETARGRWGRIDILHYNVGVSIAGGDAPLEDISEAAFDRIATINLRGAIMACKHVVPVMRAQRSGVITTISSVAAWEQYPNVVYKATKDRLHPAAGHSERGIRGARQRHPAGVDGHADGRRYPCPCQRQESGGGCRRSRCARAAAPQNGHRLGCRQRGSVSRLRRGRFHYRRGAAGRRRRLGPHQLSRRAS